MNSNRPHEEQEWLSDRIESWVETYKKAMLTPVILSLVGRHEPAEIPTIAEAIARTTEWHITERGLYRTLKRLQDSGLLLSTNVDAPRTGAKRKVLSLTPLGAGYLEGITDSLIELPRQ